MGRRLQDCDGEDLVPMFVFISSNVYKSTGIATSFTAYATTFNLLIVSFMF